MKLYTVTENYEGFIVKEHEVKETAKIYTDEYSRRYRKEQENEVYHDFSYIAFTTNEAMIEELKKKIVASGLANAERKLKRVQEEFDRWKRIEEGL